MGKHNIRPAEEEIGNLLPVFLFIIMWYSATGAILTQNGFQTILILFLAAGLLPVYQAVNSIRRAFFTVSNSARKNASLSANIFRSLFKCSVKSSVFLIMSGER